MTRIRRKTEGFNVSFLDVMSCGLGAVILLMILMEYRTELPDDQSSALLVELAQLQDKNQRAARLTDELQSLISTEDADAGDLTARLRQIKNQITTQKNLNTSLKSKRSDLETELQNMSPAAKPIPVPGKRLEKYLLGLRVEGKKIAILLDASASMADEKLIDIVKYKISSPQQRSKSPKWTRTRKIIEWLVARVPSGSDYMLIGFSKKAQVVGGKGWKKGADPADAVAIKKAVSALVPQGGTNLAAAVEMMEKEARGFTNVYLVTDGLPTRGTKNFSSIVSGCASIIGKSSNISGECRAKLLKRIVSDYAHRAPVNVILLPLEGDPLAAPAFWRWTSQTQGLLISPATSWP